MRILFLQTCTLEAPPGKWRLRKDYRLCQTRSQFLDQTLSWKATRGPYFSPGREDNSNLLKVNNLQYKLKINLANNDILAVDIGKFTREFTDRFENVTFLGLLSSLLSTSLMATLNVSARKPSKNVKLTVFTRFVSARATMLISRWRLQTNVRRFWYSDWLLINFVLNSIVRSQSHEKA